jgi:Domain of unknown function (DUF4157)
LQKATVTRQQPPAPRATVGSVQRKCPCGGTPGPTGECEECRKKRLSLQRRADGPKPDEVPPIVHEVLRSPGQPLDPETRAFFEPRFGHDLSLVPPFANRSVPMPANLTIGASHDYLEQEAEITAQNIMGRSATSTTRGHDFSRVRIHTDDKAAESARALSALAYTVGRNIVFGQSRYKPNTRAGAKLMAHELAHVIQQSGAPGFGPTPSTGALRLIHRTPLVTGVIARQPDTSQPAEPGWSDAPEKSPNRAETTVDEKGNILPGKVASKGVSRVLVQGLRHGFKGTDKGPAFESPDARAVALIPNMVKPAAPDKDKNVSVDVLLHLHGYGIGYRQLRPGEHDYPKVLKEGQLRDVELYEMEQQLLSRVTTSKRLIIAVLPQGSEKSDFGDLGSNSGAYLKEVFDKLIPRYLPEKATPGRTIVSGHSGGGPTVMAIANQRAKAGKRTDVILFDAINYSSSPESKTCTSNEITTVKNWVTNKINADVKSLDGVSEADQPANLQTKGTRFRGITSDSLGNKDTCSYGFYYAELKTHIENTIKTQKVSDAVRDQLRQNYRVLEAQRLESFKGMEKHERMIGKKNLEDALKD